jgi:lipoprotein signal peptidase
MPLIPHASKSRNYQKTVPDTRSSIPSPTKDQSPDRPKHPSALTCLKPNLILWITTAIGLTLDLLTKKWALTALKDPTPALAQGKEIIANYLHFNLVENRGAVAGIASGQTVLLISVSLAALAFLFWLFICSQPNQWPIHLALGMLFAGALGNTYDRICNHGRVIDFIEVNLHFWPANPWPTFNIADILLCIGIPIMLLTTLRHRS